MAFTRDELARYEKGEPAPAAAAAQPAAAAEEPAPAEEISAEPAGEELPATDPASSAVDGATDPDAPETDGSPADEAASAAAADPDSSPADGDDEPAEPASGSRHVPYDRFQEVVDQRNAYKKFGEYMQEQLAAARGTASTPAATATPAPAEPAAAEEPIPTLEQFDFDPVAHGKAVAAWVKKQVKTGVEQELSTRETAQTAQQIKAAFDARVDAFKKANPNSNYDVVVKNPNLPQPSQKAALAILKSENGPAIVHYLGTHPDIATRLANKPVEDQLVEIGQIEARITQPAPAPKPAAKPGAKPAANAGAKPNTTPEGQPVRTRTVSKAPPPPRPVSSGTTSTQRSALDPNLSMADFVAMERQNKMNQRQARQQMRQRMR